MEVLFESDHPLKPNDTIQFQFPNSWSLVSGPSHTRAFQTSDPQGEHYISVTALDAVQAEFALSIEKRHLNYPEGVVRHGRLITARLVAGDIPAGSQLRIGYANTMAPYVVENEELWLRVNDEAPDAPPLLQTIAGPHAYFRVLVPSQAQPNAVFDVLLVSLDAYDNPSSTPFTGETL